MKTKTGILLFFALFFTLALRSQNQVVITYPDQICFGDCAQFSATNEFGEPYFEAVWDIEGLIYQGPNIVHCPLNPASFTFYVYGPNGNIIFEGSVLVSDQFTPEIIALSGAYCPDNSTPGTNSCDAVCENTTITYTTEVNDPTQTVNWQVGGAEDYTINGNSVTVTWGEPGNGEVSVEVVSSGNPDPFSISCGMQQSANQGGSNGSGYVYISGPDDFYEIFLSDGSNYSGTQGVNNINNLSAGSYSVIVTDSGGNTLTCDFFVSESDIDCNLSVLIEVFPPSSCNECDGTLLPVIIGGGFPPYSFTWSNGSTSATSTDLCPGVYSLTIIDSEGCSTSAVAELNCDSSSSCYGFNSICVDILAIPEALFETTPPATNGVVEICEGQTVFFENQSIGAATYTWDFGNSVSSSEVDAQHTYLQAGTYQAMLIARNECFCADTSFVSILVEDAISPEIDCAGTVCPDTEVTYSTDADCSIFNWNISSNGVIISGGGPGDNFITVDWGSGPEGLIELSVDGCNGDYCLETMFEVIPIIDENAQIRGPEKVCAGADVVYSITPFTGTEFNWSVSGFGTIESGQGTNEIAVQWADQLTPILQWVAVEYESCYLGCSGRDTIFVGILSEFFIEGPIEACIGEATEFLSRTPELSNNEVLSNWTVFDENEVVVYASPGPMSSFPIDWNFGGGEFMVLAEADNPDAYCVDNYAVFVHVPDPTTVPTGISGPASICPGESYNYTAIGSFGYESTWYVTNGGSNTILYGESVNITWGGAPPYSLALTQTNTSGLACESEALNMDLQNITAVNILGTTELCHEEIGNYTATPYASVDFLWQVIPSDAGTVISGENTSNVEIQWHLAGNYAVQVSVCGVSDVFNVIVNPKPNPVPVFNVPCPGQLTSVQTSIPYTDFEWRNEAGAPFSFAPTVNVVSGYYEVIVTDANGCTNNETFYVGNLPTPEVTLSTPDFGNFCAFGGSMTLYALETTGAGAYDYQWYHNSSPIGTNTSSLVVTQEGFYQVQVTDANGCIGISNGLNLNCAGTFPGPPSPGCTPGGSLDFSIAQGTFCNQSQYTNTSVNDVPGSWYWSFIDLGAGTEGNSTLENPSYTYMTAGFHIAILQAGVFSAPPGDTCYSYIFYIDTVPLAADFSHEVGCAGELLSFTDLSTFVPQTSIAGWDWDFADPASGASNTSNLQNPVHAFTTGGIYTVTLTSTDQSGCISVRQRNVFVQDSPLSDFTVPAMSCEGATLFFEASGAFTDVSWNFGDPASGAANTSDIGDTYHLFETPGTYTITLTTENIYGCQTIVSHDVDVVTNTLAGTININPASEICDGDSTILTAPSSDSYLWSGGELTESITVFDAGIYEVTISDLLGCTYSPPSVQIDVIPLPEAQIIAVEYDQYGQPVQNFYNNYETCFGEDVFLEITENINYNYQWSTGENTTSISFTEEKENLLSVGTHVFNVSIIDVTTGCSNVIGPFTVTVHPVPEGILIASNPLPPVCENIPTVFSVVNPDPTYTYVWNTGETGTSISSFYAGEYFVRAINQFGCEGLSNTLEIIAGPNVDLIPSGCHTRCNPDTICLPAITGVQSFQWYYNGSAIPAPEGTIEDYIATQSGEYYVEMVSDFGCVTISDALTLDLFDGFGTILGNVWFDVNENGIIDAADTLMNGIPVILQNSGTNIDTLFSNINGSFAFSNIFSTDYNVLVDTFNLPDGMIAIISESPATLVGCADDTFVEFLIQLPCVDNTFAVTLEACANETAEYNGDDLDPGTSTEYIFQNAAGCDSVVTVIVEPLELSTFNVQLEACVDGTVDYNGTDLSPGSTTDFTFQNALGCDSVVTVIVGTLNTSSFDLQLEACEGEMANYDGTDLPPGSTTDFTFQNAAGCDSIVTVEVVELLESTNDVNLQACEGSTADYNGTALDPETTTEFTLVNAAGCDSTVTVFVALSMQDSFSVDFTACQGETILYDGTELDPGTQTDFYYNNGQGCDSVITVIVEELFPSSFDEQLEACTGTTVEYNSDDLPPGSTTDYTFTNAAGCDSTVTVTVIELFASSFDLDLEACTGMTVEYNSDDLPPGSTTDYTFTNAVGCDSIVTVTVEELFPSSFNVQLEACEGETANYNGDALDPGSTTDYSFLNAAGCDSTVTVFVETLFPEEEFIDFQACTGTTVLYNGDNLDAGSSTTYDFVAVNGCDSTVYVNVEELFESQITIELTACEDDFATYNGQDIPAGSSADFVFPAANGCDSTVTVDVAPLTLFNVELNLETCEGTTIEYNGDQLPPGSQTEYVFVSEDGCDSTVLVIVETLLNSSFDLTLTACENGTATYNGDNLPPGSTSNYTFPNSNGCDSLVTVMVTPLPVDVTTLELFACTDETVNYNGEELAPGFVEAYVFVNEHGCDSIVEVSVSAFPDFDFELFADESCFNASEGLINIENLVGGTLPFTYSLDGTSFQPDAVFSDLQADDYEVYVQDGNGCINTLDITVESIDPMIIVAENQLLPCNFSEVMLEVDVFADDPQAVTYQWEDNSNMPYLGVVSPGQYTVTISNSCETITQEFNVDMEDDPRTSLIFVPNVFSPNGDGMNDEFKVYMAPDVQILSFEMIVFDRWGNVLDRFYTTGDDWDGFFNGKLMNPGVYVWHYIAEVNTCGRRITLFDKGDVTLVK